MFYILDARNFLIASLLNSIIIPTARYTESKQQKKVTIKEGMTSFILHIEDASILEEEVYNLKERFASEKNTLQPIIIAVGISTSKLSNFYVYLDGVKLKFSSFLSALDSCFKIFHIFNLKYPRCCSGVWLFVQKFLYEIDTIYDQPQSCVSGLISHLKSISE